MRKFFARNIDSRGRIARGIWGALLLIGGVVALNYQLWLAAVLFALSALAIFEAFRGWCIMRACGVKTKL